MATAEQDARDEFATALKAAGLVLEKEPLMDGQLHRVPVEGATKGTRDGSYVGFLDGKPSGYIENFKTVHNPGYTSSNGNGQYVQTIDTTKLGQGYHYITGRVFRHSDDSTAPAVYTDFRDVIYIDLSKPVSTIDNLHLQTRIPKPSIIRLLQTFMTKGLVRHAPQHGRRDIRRG